MIKKMKQTILENIDQKLESVVKSYSDRILSLEETVGLMEMKLKSIDRNNTPTPPVHPISIVSTCASKSRPSFSKCTPATFQTEPGSSCCDHLCRSDMLDDPEYDKCCLHCCRKPWT